MDVLKRRLSLRNSGSLPTVNISVPRRKSSHDKYALFKHADISAEALGPYSGGLVVLDDDTDTQHTPPPSHEGAGKTTETVTVYAADGRAKYAGNYRGVTLVQIADGLYVKKVDPLSAHAAAGLLVGDRLVACAGTLVHVRPSQDQYHAKEFSRQLKATTTACVVLEVSRRAPVEVFTFRTHNYTTTLHDIGVRVVGHRVAQVLVDSPAHLAGLRVGGGIIRVNGCPALCKSEEEIANTTGRVITLEVVEWARLEEMIAGLGVAGTHLVYNLNGR
eukprot:comp21612_c1_seq1/m.30299 comp21612_c1_seq1/g.30299  ORF comp21612_c1_seq1/g.30299 comp21612_c1_seq1/m.30299 type:complete len:275 (-) comp21612_c1_seq1:701-1525(-)